MNSLLIIFSIFSNSIGRDVPSEVVCLDTKTTLSAGPGAFLDAQEALAVLHLAETYERGCADKTLSLAAARDEQQTAAEIKVGAAGFAAGASPFLAVLLRRRKKAPK